MRSVLAYWVESVTVQTEYILDIRVIILIRHLSLKIEEILEKNPVKEMTILYTCCYTWSAYGGNCECCGKKMKEKHVDEEEIAKVFTRNRLSDYEFDELKSAPILQAGTDTLDRESRSFSQDHAPDRKIVCCFGGKHTRQS